jgi:DNA/RNA-binding domain of Phe-tRNA-synthetase-like protein
VNGGEARRPPLAPAAGYVAAHIGEEFPGLRLFWVTVPARRQPSPAALRHRLADLSNRYRGANVVAMRTKPIPHAFRVFFRQIGLDPDVDRTPSEAVAVTRLLHGGFRPSDLVSDACLVALIETGVPVWALDADLVDESGLGIRTATAADCERLGHVDRLATGSLVVADGRQVHAVLFSEPLPARRVGGATDRVALYSIGVDGVPSIHLEEALWISEELLGSAG